VAPGRKGVDKKRVLEETMRHAIQKVHFRRATARPNDEAATRRHPHMDAFRCEVLAFRRRDDRVHAVDNSITASDRECCRTPFDRTTATVEASG
jgi:hypothetical protein